MGRFSRCSVGSRSDSDRKIQRDPTTIFVIPTEGLSVLLSVTKNNSEPGTYDTPRLPTP